MRVLVCFKIVRDTDLVLAADWPRGPIFSAMDLDLSGAPLKYAAFDESALELALRFKAAFEDTELTALTVRSSSTSDSSNRRLLTHLYAVGFQRVVEIVPDGVLEFRQQTVANAIAGFIEDEGGYDLILTGSVAGFGCSGKVPILLSERLSMPAVTGVIDFCPVGEGSRFTPPNSTEVLQGKNRQFDPEDQCVLRTSHGAPDSGRALLPDVMLERFADGIKAEIAIRLPALLSINNATDTWLRIPTLKAKLEAKKQVPEMRMISGICEGCEPKEQAPMGQDFSRMDFPVDQSALHIEKSKNQSVPGVDSPTIHSVMSGNLPMDLALLRMERKVVEKQCHFPPDATSEERKAALISNLKSFAGSIEMSGPVDMAGTTKINGETYEENNLFETNGAARGGNTLPKARDTTREGNVLSETRNVAREGNNLSEMKGVAHEARDARKAAGIQAVLIGCENAQLDALYDFLPPPLKSNVEAYLLQSNAETCGLYEMAWTDALSKHFCSAENRLFVFYGDRFGSDLAIRFGVRLGMPTLTCVKALEMVDRADGSKLWGICDVVDANMEAAFDFPRDSSSGLAVLPSALKLKESANTGKTRKDGASISNALKPAVCKSAIDVAGETQTMYIDGTLRLPDREAAIPVHILSHRVYPVEREPLCGSLVIAVGRGVAKADMESVFQLADELGACVAGSRAAAMNGLVAVERMVGASGAFINPDVCLTLGISGAAPFLKGLSPETKIIAVNKDRNAPIFCAADVGFCCDYQDFINDILR